WRVAAQCDWPIHVQWADHRYGTRRLYGRTSIGIDAGQRIVGLFPPELPRLLFAGRVESDVALNCQCRCPMGAEPARLFEEWLSAPLRSSCFCSREEEQCLHQCSGGPDIPG